MSACVLFHLHVMADRTKILIARICEGVYISSNPQNLWLLQINEKPMTQFSVRIHRFEVSSDLKNTNDKMIVKIIMIELLSWLHERTESSTSTQLPKREKQKFCDISKLFAMNSNRKSIKSTGELWHRPYNGEKTLVNFGFLAYTNKHSISIWAHTTHLFSEQL